MSSAEDDRPSPNIEGVRAARDSAYEVTALAQADIKPRQTPEFDKTGFALKADCPVAPLGHMGMVCYYLDNAKQLIALDSSDHGRLNIMKMFGRAATTYLYETWPRVSKEGQTTGWRPESAAEYLMGACEAKGIWNPAERERGAGAWRGDDGELVLHCGDVVIVVPATPAGWSKRQEVDPGLVGHYVYPAGKAGPRPAPTSIAADAQPRELLALLGTWRWRRAEIDPILLLGWIGAAMLGGALIWRPLIWLTGGKGTGKSTLHRLLEALFDGALIQTSDATEAGLRQTLKRTTLPVAFDELEAQEDNKHSSSVIKLARQAGSGGKPLRGGSDHEARSFTTLCAFLFSSILIPPMLGQDLSRLAILDLGELDRDAAAPALRPSKWKAVGEAIRRRLVDGWHRWDRTLEFFRAELSARGHTARGCDQFGTLLAAADLLLHDVEPCGDAVSNWIERLRPSLLVELEDDARDESRCLQELLTKPVEPYRNGGQRSVASWIRQAAKGKRQITAESLDLGDEDSAVADPVRDANKCLGLYGLKVMVDDVGAQWLAVANYHAGLAKLFQGTHWAGRSGTMGVWVQTLRRLPGADRSSKAVYFSGAVAKATLVPIALALGEQPETDAPGPTPRPEGDDQ